MRIMQAITGGIVTVGMALAASGAGNAASMSIQEKRSAFMKGLGGHMQALGAVAKGEMAADASTPVHAQAIQDMSVAVEQMFPAGSGGDKTRAKPEIWEQWDKFSAAADAMIEAAPQLVAAAKTGDRAAIGAALGAVGKTCGGCHKPFRKPKENQ